MKVAAPALAFLRETSGEPSESIMKNDRQLNSFQYSLMLLLSLLVFGCAGTEPPMSSAKNDRDEYETATKDLHKLAEGGDAFAQNEVGLLYYEGKGVPQNYRKAKEWFDKAVQQGHAGAQVNLGTLYLRGEGAPQSTQMALFWFSRAARQEDALAFAKLGLMYAQGRGVIQDFIQAHMWYNLSAAHGEVRSAEARDSLAKQMTPLQIAEAQRLAREWTPKEDKSRKTAERF
jgi:uncharacterized protein